MKVSIITPCYNAAAYIERTIAAVQQQTLSDWEMIVVDDGSTDNSADVLKKITTTDNRIKLIKKENGGTASARNLGLSVAIGDYIQFLDADDTIAPDKLQRQIDLMDTEKLDVSYTDYKITDNNVATQYPLKGFTINLTRILIGWSIFGTIPLHAFVYRTHFLQTNGLAYTSNVREREDWDFHIRVFSCKPHIKRLKGYCGAYYFRCPTGKTSSGDFRKIQQGTFRFLLYKIQHTHNIMQFLLLLRLSIGLNEVAMLTIKRKLSLWKDILPMFFQSFQTFIILIAALLLIPISCIIFIIRIIWVLTNK